MLALKHVSLADRLVDINVEVENGRFVHVLGANGAGKSSLLAVIAGLLSPDAGHIHYHCQDLSSLSLQSLSQVRCFQQQSQHSSFDIKVHEALSIFSGNPNLPEELDNAVEISAFMARSMQSLSGGESRRVHIARVLLQIWPQIVKGQGLILLDEPIQGLDFKHQILLFDLLKSLSAKGNLIIVNHHSLALCDRYSDQVWLMKNGTIAHAGGTMEVLQEDCLSDTFGCRVKLYQHHDVRLFQTYIDYSNSI